MNYGIIIINFFEILKILLRIVLIINYYFRTHYYNLIKLNMMIEKKGNLDLKYIVICNNRITYI